MQKLDVMRGTFLLLRRVPALVLLALVLSTAAAEAHPRHPHPQNLPPAVFPPRVTAPYTIAVDANPTHVLNRFAPDAAFGVGVDGSLSTPCPRSTRPPTSSRMLGAGFGAVSYRLYTELSVQDWHWNPAGSYSGGTSGYWTSATALGDPIVDTYGYRLPRRGFTHDQGTDDDYSRLDDGDLATFLEEQPVPDADLHRRSRRFSSAVGALRPAPAASSVNAAKIWWGSPFAVQYAVQYWTGDDPIYDPGRGAWVNFPAGAVSDGAGGTVTLSLGDAPNKVRYLRIAMSQSSGSCTTPGSADPRDCAGYAIAEAGFGTMSHGNFTDLVEHRPDRKQTATYASSVDPVAC